MKPEEIEEYKAYLSSQGFTPEETEEYIQHAGIKVEEPSFGRRALDYGLRALDYTGGIARTAAGEVADAFVPGDIVTSEDWKKAAKGQAPGTAELMDRAGVPEGSHYNLMPEIPIPFTDVTLGKGDSSARDIGGFVGDVALDPLTYASLGTSAAAKKAGTTVAKEALNPLGRLSEALGKMSYKSGMKKIDQEVAKYGKEPVSDILLKNRVSGSAQTISNKMDEIAQGLKASRDKILARATESGAQVDMRKAMQGAQEMVDKLKATADPDQLKLIETMEKNIKLYADTAAEPGRLGSQMEPLAPKPGPNPEQVSQWKSNTYNKIGDAGYNELKQTPVGKQFEKAKARGMKEGVEDAVGQSLGAADQSSLIQMNDELGRVLTSDEKAAQVAQQEANKNAFTSVDGLALAMGPKMAALKKLADVLKGSRARTRAGLTMYDLGRSGAIDPVARQALINHVSPWRNMARQQKQK